MIMMIINFPWTFRTVGLQTHKHCGLFSYSGPDFGKNIVIPLHIGHNNEGDIRSGFTKESVSIPMMMSYDLL
jgi:hypothetical protein